MQTYHLDTFSDIEWNYLSVNVNRLLYNGQN